HRGRGQQQITVKHVTTNNVTADQAIIAESVTTGAAAASPALLAASSETPNPLLDEIKRHDQVGVGRGRKRNERQPHAKRPRCSQMRGEIKADRAALPIASGRWFSSLPDARRRRWSTGGETKW